MAKYGGPNQYDGPSKSEIDRIYKDAEKDIRAKIATEIRAELVCCDMYDQVQEAVKKRG